MKIGKYEFNSKEQADDKIAALGIEKQDDGKYYPTHNHTIIYLGYNVLEQPTFDVEGNILTEAVFGNKYMVDVLWVNLEADENGEIDHPYGWKSYSININDEGCHSFYGQSYQELKFQ